MKDKQPDYSGMAVEDILQKLKTSRNGLDEAEARFRLEKDGPNLIAEKKEAGLIIEFLSHFNSPLVLVLLAAALISAFLGEIRNFVVITIIVVASIVLDFIEEHSAGNAARKLKEKVSITSIVVRGGRKKEIKSSEVCVGDVLFLVSGDLVPADARIIEADDFFVNQSSLTGESFPQEKTSEKEEDEAKSPVESQNMAWLGTNVVSGTALAVVVAIGRNTQFGKIAKAIAEKEQKSEFENGIAKFGIFISKVIIVLVLAIFLSNALLKGKILESFIFAVAIAVGVTPELLPMIMSITMARGSRQMAKHGVIVKKLSSIPNFGSMDILCTDKTGTITEDNIRLVRYIDIYGQENDDVFLYTFLNSFYQTGVKNPLDKAVLDFKKININQYQKIEEIPFNFFRRMMSIAVIGPDGRTLITKGAPESVIAKCTEYIKNGGYAALTKEASRKAIKKYEEISAEGYRVLAVAVRKNLEEKKKYTTDDESDLTLLGFVSFLDPAKKGVKEVLNHLNNYGIEIKVITGDNELVTRKICREVGLNIRGEVLGPEIESLTDDALGVLAEKTTIFARFSPSDKNRTINALRDRGHVVGYMGDGINDAPSLKTADVGISVNDAVDVAKESADIVLTKKSLRPIINGVLEGRRSFANTMKYLMMGLSSNFGNMFSVIAAVFYLPFLPMLPIQILLNNFIYDFSQVTIPVDNVDQVWLQKQRKWNMNAVKKFMYIFGPISSVFDVLTFFILFSFFRLGEAAFQTGWFLESLATQTLVIHVIRTKRVPLIQSRANKLLFASTLTAVAIGWMIPYAPLGGIFKFVPLPFHIILSILALVIVYLLIVEAVKRIYYRKNDSA